MLRQYVPRPVLAALVAAGLLLAQAPLAHASPNVLTAAPSTPAASTPQAPATDLNSLTRGIQRHLVQDRGGYYFDSESAAAAGESALVLEAGANYNALAGDLRSGNSSQPHQGTARAAVKMPVWGNWCGPGHSGPGAPKDTLDTLCMRHDKCYAARGYFDCYCDAQLKAEIKRFSGRMGFKERAMAAAITVAFSALPCKP